MSKGNGNVTKPLEKPLRRAIALLEKHDYRYAVIGGIAVQYWGLVRLTVDVDVKVLVPQTDYATARSRIRAVFPQRGRPQIPPDPLVVDTNIGGVVVDFLLAAPGYEENIITRAVRKKFGAMMVWLCTAEDLIIQKVIAGRGKDWQDIEGVLGLQMSRLDFDYIENWLKDFADILAEPEIFEKYIETRDSVRKILAKKKSGRV